MLSETNLMVQKPGGYRFGDYPKLGFPITGLAFVFLIVVFSFFEVIGLFMCPGIALLVWPATCSVGANCTAVNATNTLMMLNEM